MENGLGITKLGITASKKTGNAVQRNKIKRRVREYFRLHKSCFPKGYDIVITAKRGADTLDFWKIKEELSGPFLGRRVHG